MDSEYPRICLVAFFTHDAFFTPLSNIRKITGQINPQYRSIIIISPELVERIFVDIEKDDVIIHKSQDNLVFRVINYFFLNIKISWYILLRSEDVDCYLFFKETGLLLPMVFAKILNKKIIWLLPASLWKMIEHIHDISFLVLKPVQEFSYRVADNIVLYSPNLIKEWKLQNYTEKICIAHEHLIDFDMFKIIKPLSDRPFLIGYVGRLSEEKGVCDFVQALPEILNNNRDIHVFIGGDGPLKDEIIKFLYAENLVDRVTMMGWIAHVKLPEYLNNLRLLILPSYTEGLPNILLEAIACGTPVVATPVGAIPDIINDGKTGFILKDQTSSCIEKTIIKALDEPNLEKISMNAKKIVENEFTLEKTIQTWKEISQKK